MSLLQTVSHAITATDGIYNKNSPKMSSMIVTPVDTFLSQYIKSCYIKTSLNNHEFLGEIDRSLTGYLLATSPRYLQSIVGPTKSPLKKERTDDHFNYIAVKSGKIPLENDQVTQDIRANNHVNRVKNQLNDSNIEAKRAHRLNDIRNEKTVQKQAKLDKHTDKIDEFTYINKELPQQFMDCPVDDLINLLARMLQSLITLNDKSVPLAILNPKPNESSNLLTRYHSRAPPSISTHKYLSRLTKFNNFNPATLLTTIYYIDLLSHQYQPYFTLNSWTVHRFLLVATMLSQKSMEDFFYTNDHYAKVGGVDISELNCLELDFLSRVDWRCIPVKNIDGKSSIKYAHEVLYLYYNQLIELMGKNLKIGNNNYNYYLSKATQTDSLQHDVRKQQNKSHEEDSDDDMDDDDDEDNIDMDEDGDDDSASECLEMKTNYDENGYAVDKGSSPHLKRRYSQYE